MKRFAKQIGLIVLMMSIGTFIDFLVHSSRDSFAVEPEYYVGKMVFGVIWGLLGFWALRYILAASSPTAYALGVPAIIASVLQTKYFYQGRDNFFVFLFLVLHFLMFLPGSFYIFKRHAAVFIDQQTVAIQGYHQKLRWAIFIGLAILTEVAFYLYFQFVVGYDRF